ncbi:Glucans biosynthesis protein D precursor [Hartmannibacter diazotrophicus]|uniref:Glucans biosynthesis protein D n=2 Tax=Hartmannibacter diazotrophicus TaxID=1482074 RepID=A0A2C9D1H0_9HYPH|nr:Glucans biosynthesis protein D precursor [Hartmannibacter diazotrophicus]
MTSSFNRREFAQLTGGLLAALGIVAPTGEALAEVRLGKPEPFSFDGLIAAMKEKAAKPYVPPKTRASDILDKIDYDAHWKIQFRPDHTLELGGGKAPIRFFHLGRYFKDPVGINVIDGNTAKPVLYGPDYFDMPKDSPARELPKDIGFAGFRVMEEGEKKDWLAFLGAAYFRSSGELDQFGMSARAVAIDVAMPTPEEFPRFTDFWFAPLETGTLTIYMAMDGPSITGAIRMDCDRSKGVVMDISAHYFMRKDIARLGLAALTSMFWFDELNARNGKDWRPEIHDSDGLAIWNGNGERLWRPLNNPPTVMTSSFVDQNIKGFALEQRDRNFDHYQDDGVFYEKRSTVWVEPKGDWGPGTVQLVEIPTDDEIHDNIVAYFIPEKPAKAGDEVAVDYRLHWVAEEPYVPPVARVWSTRAGMGGVPGQPRPKGVIKFVVDFEGGGIGKLGQQDGVEAVVEASSGKISGVYTLPVVGTERWRAVFDFTADGTAPVEMRLFLKDKTATLSETWLYQYHPGTLVPLD